MVVHPSSHGIPRVPRYSGYGCLTHVFTYGILTLYDRPSHALRLTLMIACAVRTPRAARNALRTSVEFRVLSLELRRVPRILTHNSTLNTHNSRYAFRAARGLASCAFARHYLRNLVLISFPPPT